MIMPTSCDNNTKDTSDKLVCLVYLFSVHIHPRSSQALDAGATMKRSYLVFVAVLAFAFARKVERRARVAARPRAVAVLDVHHAFLHAHTSS